MSLHSSEVSDGSTVLGASDPSALQGLRHSLSVVWRGWWLVAVCGLVCGVLGLGVSVAATPMYESSATVYVTSGSDDNAQTAYQGSLASQQRVGSYAKLVTSDAVIDVALQEGRLSISKDTLVESVKAYSAPDTVLLTIEVLHEDPVVAATAVNAIANSLTEYVTKLETPDGSATPLAKMTVVSPGYVNSSPVSPRTLRNVLVSIGLGVVLGAIFAFIRDRLDTKVRSVSQVESLLNVPTVGVIPEDSAVSGRGVVDFGAGSTPISEAYRRLRANLSFVSVDNPAKVVLVTSPMPSEGKSTTSINLASAMADAGKRVLLVDADLRKPSISAALVSHTGVGLSNVLRGDAHISDIATPSAVAGLDVVGSGPLPPNPTELLASERAAAVLAELGELYDYVVVDTPPAIPFTDSVVTAPWVDGVLLVARADKTKKADLVAAAKQFVSADATLLGVVLNDVSSGSSAGDSYAYYAYNSYGDDGSAGSEQSSVSANGMSRV